MPEWTERYFSDLPKPRFSVLCPTWGGTAGWTAAEGEEVADAERDPNVRRAALVPFRSRPSSRRTAFLRHMRERYPELRYTTKWVDAA